MEIIQRTFYKLKKEYPILKPITPFSTSDVYPFSRVLEDAISTLQNTRIIGMENPDFERYIIKDKGKEFVKNNILSLFFDDELRQIRAMAKIFEKECGIND
jgi:hypothetical protein